MTLQELKNNATFHEVLLMDATIKAYDEMMKDCKDQQVQKTATEIAREINAKLLETRKPLKPESWE